MKLLTTSGLVCILAATLACGPKDHTKVLATVGSEKITEKVLEDQVRLLAPTAEDAKLFLSDERKAEREQFLDRIVQIKSIVAYGKLEGLEKDPKARLLVEQAVAQTYLSLLMERRMQGVKATDAQLKAEYDEVAGRARQDNPKAELPPFEQVKEQLAQRWKQKQAAEVQANLIKEMDTKVKVVKAQAAPPAGASAPAPTPKQK